MSVFERFRGIAAAHADQVALVVQHDAGDESLTFGRLLADALGLAGWLAARGLEPGAPCALLAPNSAAWVSSYLGVLAAGGVAVPLDLQADPEQTRSLLADAGARFLFTTPSHLARLGEHGLEVVLLEGAAPPTVTHAAAAAHAPTAGVPARGSDDPALILYTSGSTGIPKGVALTQGNVLATVEGIHDALPVGAGDRSLSILPFFHILAQLTGILVPLLAGTSVRLVTQVEPRAILRALEVDRITVFCCVPRFFYLIHQRVLERVAASGLIARVVFSALRRLNGALRRTLGVNLGRRVFSSVHRTLGGELRYLISGGSRFDPAVAGWFHDLGFDLLQGFGLTECCGTATFTRPETNRLGSVGRPIRGVEVRLVAEPGERSGELQLRGPNVMRGYHRRPEETAAAFDDGWLRTGDRGHIDASGDVFVTGRSKDVIALSSGKKIAPEELEGHYQGSPFFAEVCVTARASASGSPLAEELHLIVVPHVEALRKAGIYDVPAHVRWEVEGRAAALPPHLRIRSFELRLEPLPRTTTGKLRRFLIQPTSGPRPTAPARAWTDADRELAARPIAAAALEVVRRLAARDVHPDEGLDLDLGLDSLGRLDLVHQVEQATGVRISRERVERAFTVRELIQAALEAEGARDGTAAESLWAVALAPRPGEPPPVLPPGALASWSVIPGLFALRLVARVLFRARLEGREHLPPGRFILCCNHQSVADGALVLALLPARTTTRLFSVGAVEYFAGPAGRALARALAVVASDHTRDATGTLRTCAGALATGRSLLVFPEGARSTDGRLWPFKRGPAILAAHLGLPLVPLAIDGTGAAWPRGQRLPRPGRVRLRIGRPIAPPPTPAEGAAAAEWEAYYQRLTSELEGAVVRELAALRSGEPSVLG